MAERIDENIERQEDTQYGKYLTFALGEEIYGIEIRHVIEIIGIQAITKVPNVPAYVKGIINLRGKIIPAIDMRLKFNKEPLAYNDRTCIIVIEINQIPVGLIVDFVDEVLNISDEDIAPPPNTKTNANNKYIQGIGKSGDQVQLLLDCEELLLTEEVSLIDED
ncbi:MAG: chemotaxis protein CheW [Eubacteriales bacterium]|nr:chemotaxis protein CheW [Eubacteriales bacterium]MDD3349781.1 chemotaxis protein CheW [Eubacteriales bacterium]